jgi:demethylmenaquinone methyltransferase/2-methoxy-6-polyprenyl-1,4-benzoquinol methylase
LPILFRRRTLPRLIGLWILPQELHRVLRPGCSVAVLDFNNAADNSLVDAAQALFLERMVVPAARSMGVAEEYE